MILWDWFYLGVIYYVLLMNDVLNGLDYVEKKQEWNELSRFSYFIISYFQFYLKNGKSNSVIRFCLGILRIGYIYPLFSLVLRDLVGN